MNTYTFAPALEYLIAHDWKAGDSIPVQWKIREDSMTGGPPIPITLTVSILGPVSSKEEINDLIDQGTAPIVTDQVVVNDQTGILKPRAMKLPSDLGPGTYGVVAYVEKGNKKTEATTIIKVGK